MWFIKVKHSNNCCRIWSPQTQFCEFSSNSVKHGCVGAIEGFLVVIMCPFMKDSTNNPPPIAVAITVVVAWTFKLFVMPLATSYFCCYCISFDDKVGGESLSLISEYGNVGTVWLCMQGISFNQRWQKRIWPILTNWLNPLGILKPCCSCVLYGIENSSCL